MDFADLQTFRAVVDHGGVTAAARRLHRVQSSISARLGALERDLGCLLFERAGRRLQLTPEGRHLYDRSASLVREMDVLRQELAGTAQGAVLRIGAMESTAAARLAPVLARLRQQQPGLQLAVRTGTTGALLQALEDHEIDAALVAGAPGRPGLDWQAVYQETLVRIAPRQPLPEGGCALVTFSSGCAYREVALDWARTQPLTLGPGIEIGSYHALVAAVSAGMGTGLVPRSVLQGVDRRGLAEWPLEPPWNRQTTWLATRRDSRSAALQALREALPAGVDADAAQPAGAEAAAGA
ncbi:MAG: LysR family transcriptional regulator [Curvibacter sp.]|nr:LysR family transcriptional regulator [Curvibacter sp.]